MFSFLAKNIVLSMKKGTIQVPNARHDFGNCHTAGNTAKKAKKMIFFQIKFKSKMSKDVLQSTF